VCVNENEDEDEKDKVSEKKISLVDGSLAILFLLLNLDKICLFNNNCCLFLLSTAMEVGSRKREIECEG